MTNLDADWGRLDDLRHDLDRASERYESLPRVRAALDVAGGAVLEARRVLFLDKGRLADGSSADGDVDVVGG